ncbi:hypothetical protein [Endozoicomonas sp. SCSIO W0465]|uniref:hypothetical protein n=1 Tax=Endozoicomonas sp. SCSIO W0465 TaxID=2918516 RepID=UPI002075B198|nr:hypothetical protein [Endozoicomonas sp. SCSIO W0465]USE36987.1 hypothetical protein MJO57_01745 [Endozoicomonas sp. SCSIO W0465]
MDHSITKHECRGMPDEQPVCSDDLLKSLALLTRHYGNPNSTELLNAGRPHENGQFSAKAFIRTSEQTGLAGTIHDRPSPMKLHVKTWYWHCGTILGSWRINCDVLLQSLLIHVFVISSLLIAMIIEEINLINKTLMAYPLKPIFRTRQIALTQC